MSSAHRSILWMLLVVALMTAVEALGALLHDAYSGYQIVWTRYAVHLVFMLVIWGRRNTSRLWHTERPAFQLSRSMLMVGMPVSYLVGMRLGANQLTFWSLFWIAPLLILALARVFLHESAPVSIWIAAFFAFVGASLLSWTGVSISPVAALLAVITALTFSAYVVMTRSLRNEPITTNLFFTALGVFVVLSPMMFRVWHTPTMPDALIMVAIGLVGFYALYAIDRAATAAPVSAAAPVAYWQVVMLFGGVRGIGHLFMGRRAPAALAAIVLATMIVWLRANGVSSTDHA